MPMNGSDHPGAVVMLSPGQMAEMKAFFKPVIDLATIALKQATAQDQIADDSKEKEADIGSDSEPANDAPGGADSAAGTPGPDESWSKATKAAAAPAPVDPPPPPPPPTGFEQADGNATGGANS